MKSKRTLFELALLLAIAILLAGKFWPVKDISAPAVATVAPSITKSAVTTTPAIKAAVEAPNVPPVPVAPAADGFAVPGNGRALYDASKGQTAPPDADGITDDDAKNFVKNSPALVQLRDILAKTESLTQNLSPSDSTTLPPPLVTVTDLGQINLTLDQPVMRKLTSDDQVVISLVTHPDLPGRNGAVLTIETKFLYQSGGDWIQYPGGSGFTILNGPSVKSGQEMRVKSIASGNEIHFVPMFTTPSDTSP